ncbi:MAG: hypothetical protein AOA65_0373 [Candidatus Bathyarchaeota archaeon BA1]|nr:MAG: hypothetical protein AOA65_0373 [Candidatus Bathyarchaeota archaeon BA1]
MEILEALRVVDRKLLEWLMKRGLELEEREALVKARSALSEIESRIVMARIVDPEEYREYCEGKTREIEKISTK